MASDTLSTPFVLNSIGNNQLIAADPDHRIQVVGFMVVNAVATAQSFRIRGGTANNFTGAMALPSSVGGSLSMIAPYGGALFTGNRNEVLNLSLTAATEVDGFIIYRLIHP